ncbi:hypothetical protein C0081_20175 [Cohaesibacter celericrescens]|uniref:Uncharacterized protein n=1 Tax=Cohaesibacter celericrescens TaxID=2067669 RepID=A0A2N5XLS1_9HYPH|nr:hypothetical protein C0081_20175 [Cohaesibacter celericrescens]
MKKQRDAFALGYNRTYGGADKPEASTTAETALSLWTGLLSRGVFMRWRALFFSLVFEVVLRKQSRSTFSKQSVAYEMIGMGFAPQKPI